MFDICITLLYIEWVTGRGANVFTIQVRLHYAKFLSVCTSVGLGKQNIQVIERSHLQSSYYF